MARIRRYRVGQCPECLGWGELVGYRDCSPCSAWRKRHPQRVECQRCCQQRHVNSDGLCRPCLQIIRDSDAAWLERPVPGQSSQLSLVLPRQYRYISRPLDMLKDRPRRTREWQRRWQRDQAPELAEVKDDPRICPPAIPGQLTLIRPHRQLSIQHEQRIRHRRVRGYGQAEPIVLAHAAKYGLGRAWQLAVSRMARLALAIRDADGDEAAGADAVNDLPIFAAVVTEMLRCAGLLQPGVALAEHRRRLPAAGLPPQPIPRSCQSCQCWGFESTCEPCQQWARGHAGGPRPLGRCIRCHRDRLAVLADLCRGCTAYVAVHGPAVLEQCWTQLWLGGTLALRINAAAAGRSFQPPPPGVRLSPGLIDPAQGTLFGLPRDWASLPLAALPTLSRSAQQLVDQLDALARDQRWHEAPRAECLRTLRILLAWLGADAPIPEVEIMALVTTVPGLSAKRVITFLAERHLLVPDPAKQYDPYQQRVERIIGALSAAFADDLRRWIAVLRGQGRRQHQALSWNTINGYVNFVRPVLHDWQSQVGSLREITREHVTLAIKQRKGSVARGVHVGLRSLFQALKQERVIFRDPTKGIVASAAQTLPTSIAAERLRGMLDHGHRPATKVVIALAAIHGLRPTDIARALLADLDLSAGRLIIRRVTGQHVVYLDELTHGLIAAWLRHRRERWPKSTNPHLLVSRQTAMDAQRQSVGLTALLRMLEPLGVTPSALRADRILDEARHTADPIHLMRLFGISDGTALKYVFAAHPERQTEVIH